MIDGANKRYGSRLLNVWRSRTPASPCMNTVGATRRVARMRIADVVGDPKDRPTLKNERIGVLHTRQAGDQRFGIVQCVVEALDAVRDHLVAAQDILEERLSGFQRLLRCDSASHRLIDLQAVDAFKRGVNRRRRTYHLAIAKLHHLKLRVQEGIDRVQIGVFVVRLAAEVSELIALDIDLAHRLLAFGAGRPFDELPGGILIGAGRWHTQRPATQADDLIATGGLCRQHRGLELVDHWRRRTGQITFVVDQVEVGRPVIEHAYVALREASAGIEPEVVDRFGRRPAIEAVPVVQGGDIGCAVIVGVKSQGASGNWVNQRVP